MISEKQEYPKIQEKASAIESNTPKRHMELDSILWHFVFMCASTHGITELPTTTSL